MLFVMIFYALRTRENWSISLQIWPKLLQSLFIKSFFTLIEMKSTSTVVYFIVDEWYWD